MPACLSRGLHYSAYHFTKMCSGSEAGSNLRLIDSCIAQLKARGPSRTQANTLQGCTAGGTSLPSASRDPASYTRQALWRWVGRVALFRHPVRWHCFRRRIHNKTWPLPGPWNTSLACTQHAPPQTVPRLLTEPGGL